ncbi:MAG: YoaK family protein [Bacillus sp. (in: firmicutes)]
MNHIKNRIFSMTPDSLLMGMMLALVGGYLDAYTYITRDGVFATAQTGNTVLFAVRAASTEHSGAILNVPPFVAFIAGVLVAEHMKERLGKHRRAVLILECIILFIVGFIPSGLPDMIVTMAIAFVSSLQIATFNKLEKWSYNSTITTGNLRTAAQASYAAFADHDPESMRQFKAFAAIILSFISGALIGTFFSVLLGNISIWIASGIILLIIFLYKKTKQSQPVRSKA